MLFCFVAALLPFMIGSVSASLSDGASNACVPRVETALCKPLYRPLAWTVLALAAVFQLFGIARRGIGYDGSDRCWQSWRYWLLWLWLLTLACRFWLRLPGPLGLPVLVLVGLALIFGFGRWLWPWWFWPWLLRTLVLNRYFCCITWRSTGDVIIWYGDSAIAFWFSSSFTSIEFGSFGF